MKIVAGSLRGRSFRAPEGAKTHPMSERVKAALFNILGDIRGLRVLDGFGGSGALVFEAISRGAKSATVLERDRKAASIIRENSHKLGLNDQVNIVQAPSAQWSDRNLREKYDLILCDPPYNVPQLSTIEKLTRHLKNTSVMIVSYRGRGPTPTVNGVVVVDDRSYGDAALAFYRKKPLNQ